MQGLPKQTHGSGSSEACCQAADRRRRLMGMARREAGEGRWPPANTCMHTSSKVAALPLRQAAAARVYQRQGGGLL